MQLSMKLLFQCIVDRLLFNLFIIISMSYWKSYKVFNQNGALDRLKIERKNLKKFKKFFLNKIKKKSDEMFSTFSITVKIISSILFAINYLIFLFIAYAFQSVVVFINNLTNRLAYPSIFHKHSTIREWAHTAQLIKCYCGPFWCAKTLLLSKINFGWFFLWKWKWLLFFSYHFVWRSLKPLSQFCILIFLGNYGSFCVYEQASHREWHNAKCFVKFK